MARLTSLLLLLLAAVCIGTAAAQTISGPGGSCSLRGPGAKCASEQTCADWVNGGTCCSGSFVTKIGDFCSVANGVCCMDSLVCKDNKCVKPSKAPGFVAQKVAPPGGRCDFKANGITCGRDHKCINWLNGGICCYASLYTEGAYCDVANDLCCQGSLECKNSKCSRKPPPCNSFGLPGSTCNLLTGQCCSGDKTKCVNAKCVAPGPPPCKQFSPIGGNCDPSRGFCCGGNKVSCTQGRCISPYPNPGPSNNGAAAIIILPANTKPANNRPPACNQFEQIGGNCDPSRGICCGGNRVSCMSGRCIASQGGRKLA